MHKFWKTLELNLFKFLLRQKTIYLRVGSGTNFQHPSIVVWKSRPGFCLRVKMGVFTCPHLTNYTCMSWTTYQLNIINWTQYIKYIIQYITRIRMYTVYNIDISRNTCATTWQIATGKKKQIAGHYWLRTGQSQFVWNKSILEKRREEPSLFVINRGYLPTAFMAEEISMATFFTFVANKFCIVFFSFRFPSAII